MHYPTRSYIMIEPAVQFMRFLLQWDQFNYSSVNIYRQELVYDLILESSYSRDITALSMINDFNDKSMAV